MVNIQQNYSYYPTIPQGYQAPNYLAANPIALTNNNRALPNYYNQNNIAPYDQFKVSQDLLNKEKAKNLKLEGNRHRLQGNYKQAIEYYKKSLEFSPNYTDVLYNLGRTYRDVGDTNQAINTFNTLLQIDPQDFESRTLLGEFHEDLGNLDTALSVYQKVLKYAPNYDYANRNLQNAYIKKISLTDTNKADQIVQNAANKNLAQALKLIQEKAPQYIQANLQGITIAFGLTEEVNKYENLAQYENSNKRILISNKLVFASPSVIATYLVHEAVHAGDRDPITSVREEQDAFREMTKFWIENNNGIIDPDLTLAMNLFLQNPINLDQKVADLYQKRDTNIRLTSPNHGEPSGSGSILDNLYDILRSMLPVNSINNTTRMPQYPSLVPVNNSNPFANRQYAVPAQYNQNNYYMQQPRLILPDLGLVQNTR